MSVKVTITLDRYVSLAIKAAAMVKIHQALGSNVSISGDVITVDDGWNERQVTDILKRENVKYSRSP